MNSSISLGSRTIEYAVEGDTYVVVAVMDGISQDEAKRIAQLRAAEMTVAQGSRYFVIDSMSETEVIKTEEGSDSQRFYGNMYQELIIERDFDRERQARRPLPTTETYSAVRLQFTMYKERPNRKAIDACSLTPCR
jgi:hypothetical protein